MSAGFALIDELIDDAKPIKLDLDSGSVCLPLSSAPAAGPVPVRLSDGFFFRWYKEEPWMVLQRAAGPLFETGLLGRGGKYSFEALFKLHRVRI